MKEKKGARDKGKLKCELDNGSMHRLKCYPIQKAYKERGLNYTLSETLNIIAHPYIKAYLDQRLDDMEEQLFVESRRIRAWK